MSEKWGLKLAALGLAMGLIAGCGSDNPSDAEGAKPITLGLSYDSLESAWLVVNHAAVIEEAKKRGAEIISVMAEGDAAKQNVQIENLIARRVDAILCFPKDSSAIVKSIKQCRAAGIPIVMINRSVSGPILPDVQIVANNKAMARDVLNAFAVIARREGKTYQAVLLVGNLSDENAVLRKAGHHEALAQNPDVFNLLAEVPTEWESGYGFERASKCIAGQSRCQSHRYSFRLFVASHPVRSGAAWPLGENWRARPFSRGQF